MLVRHSCGLIMARRVASSRGGTVTTILCRGLILLETFLAAVVVGKFLKPFTLSNLSPVTWIVWK